MEQKNKTLYESLLNFQKQLPDIKKDKTAGMGKFQYKYCSLENLISTIQPVLHANGLILIQPQGYNDHGQTLLVTRLIHVQSGEEIKSEMPLFLPENMGPKPQFAWGGGLTYGRRYAIKMLLGIEPDMDTNTEIDTELGDVKELPKKTGITRTQTRPDAQIKKEQPINNQFINPALREEVSQKLVTLKKKDEKKANEIIENFKNEFDLKSELFSKKHITTAAQGHFLQQALSS
tara:strand:+ start:1169 stop:1867 length:699 start_codon:yes stop_codon:yes gene_type:complete